MRELYLKTVTMEDEGGKTRIYDYAILVDELGGDSVSVESYGLKITERGSGACRALPHITASSSRIEELSRLVLAGQVTPVTLYDVVQDWL